MFFSLDGIDGVGKSTQLALLADWLRERGRTVVACRDPGSTELGERLREILLQKSDTPIGRRSEMLMYMAARAQLVEQLIAPALAAGKVVLCDRFLLANVVYQGHAGGLDADDLWRVGLIATAGIEPDLTFLLDLPVAAAAGRRSGEADRMESQGDRFMERVRQGFLAEAMRRPQRIRVLAADRSVDAVQTEIREIAAAALQQPPAAAEAL